MRCPVEKRIDILIRGGTAVTLSERGNIIEDAEIGIGNGEILFIRRGSSKDPLPESVEIIDGSGRYILPGLVNTHCHMPMVCFRGLADDLPLDEWLSGHIFPAEARFVDPAFCAAGARLAIAELILSGTTTVCDSYFIPGAVASVALDAGMRAVICAGFADFSVPGIPDPAKNENIAENFIDRWKGSSRLLTPALFCHAPYTCSPKTMSKIKAVAGRRGVLFLTHLAETRWEVDEINRRYGTTPLRHLDRLGVLDGATILVHCTWLDDKELDILAERRCAVSHNPESNMKLAAGVAPLPAMRSRGIVIGLGTDGAASNNDLDLFCEMRTAVGIHRHASRNRDVMDALSALRMATIEGARVLGLEDKIGSLEEGKRADIILVDREKPRMAIAGDPCELLLWSASGADVSTVLIDGKIVVRERKLTTIDAQRAMEEVRNIAEAIGERN